MGNRLSFQHQNSSLSGLSDDADDEEDSLLRERDMQIRLLQRKVRELEDELADRPQSWDKAIDAYVDKWFEENKSAVDIGEIEIMGNLKVDLLPDELEKHIYKKVIKIMFSLIHQPQKATSS